MAKPINILYVDDSDESQQVEELLKSNGIEYDRWDFKSPSGFKPPYLMSKEGNYKGLEGVKAFVNLKKGEINA